VRAIAGGGVIGEAMAAIRSPSRSVSGKPTHATYTAHNITTVTPDQITGADGMIDAAKLCRLLQLIQNNSAQATLPARSNPLGICNLVQGVSIPNGNSLASIKHGLNTSWTGVIVTRAQDAIVTVGENLHGYGQSTPKTIYACLVFSSTGGSTVDLLFFAS
jgi:hypothetical protein